MSGLFIDWPPPRVIMFKASSSSSPHDALLLKSHHHNYLSDEHSENEVRTYYVIALCAASMFIEIIFGAIFGSLALIADGIHMGTHVIAFLISAVVRFIPPIFLIEIDI